MFNNYNISVFGFLLGFSVASAFAAYHLLDEYKLASSTLQTSIEELQLTTQKVIGIFLYICGIPLHSLTQVSAHIRRIEAVEKELKALTEGAAGKEDVNRVRVEMKKLYDGLHVGMFLLHHSTPFRMLNYSFRIPGPEVSCLGYP